MEGSARPAGPDDSRVLAQSAGADPARAPAPLTERVLAELGPPRLLWVALWGISGALFWYAAGVVYHSPAYQGLPLLLTYAYINTLAFWGTRRVTQQVEATAPRLRELTGGVPGADLFRPIGSTAGPLALVAAAVCVLTVVDFLRYPSVLSATLIPLTLVGFIPVWTFVWVFLSVLYGMHRLGCMPLTLAPFQADRSLGLQPVGALAFLAFRILTALAVPVVIFGYADGRPAALAAVVFGGGVTLFFMSLVRLRAQMRQTKVRHLAWAASLYDQASQPVRATRSPDMLRTHALDLLAAESLQQRASTIQEWPFPDAILTRIAAVTTSVAAITIATFLIRQLGL